MRADAPEFIPSQHRLSTASTASTNESTSISTIVSKTAIYNPIITIGREKKKDGRCNVQKREEFLIRSNIPETNTKSSSLTRRARKKKNDQKSNQCITTVSDQTYLNPTTVSPQRKKRQESQRKTHNKQKTDPWSQSRCEPKTIDSINIPFRKLLSTDNKINEYDDTNFLNTAQTSHKHNIHGFVKRNEIQRPWQRRKKPIFIPQLVSNQRKDDMQGTEELFASDLFPPLHVSSDSNILLGTSTRTEDHCGSNKTTRSQQVSKWSTAIIKAHLQQYNNQKLQLEYETKMGTSPYLSSLTKHPCKVVDDSLSVSSASIDENEEGAIAQDKSIENSEEASFNIQLLQSPHCNKDGINNKLIKTKKLKQRWMQIWDSKFPATTQPDFSSIHPTASLEVSSSTVELANGNDWEFVLSKTPRNDDQIKNYPCCRCASPDDDSSSSCTDIYSTTQNSNNNCLADDVSFTYINASTMDGTSCSEETTTSASSLSELSNYISKPFPLHAAILNDNLLIVQHLLCQDISLTRADQLASWEDLSCIPPPLVKHDAETGEIKMKPIHLSIILDKYQMVKALVDHESKSNSNSESLSINSLSNCNQTPLMVASYLGLESCTSLLLINGAKLNIKDNSGDTALHHCCRSKFLTGIELLLHSARNRNVGNNLHRILCSRNGKGQSPYHVACAAGDNTVMEKLLSTASVAITMKALQISDENGRTPLLLAIENGAVDIVESLVLWRRNQQRFLKQKANDDAEEVSSSTYCPLLLAIHSENLEMLRLLLELWGGMKNSRLDRKTLHNALLHAAQSSGSFQHDALRVLIESGANPFGPSDSFEYNSSLGLFISNSVVSFVSCCGDISSLKVILDSFRLASNDLRAQRRQDHFLRNRPSLYFEAIEKKEDDNFSSGMQDALIESLFASWRTNGSNDVGKCKSLLTSAYLLKSGAVFNEAGYSRLLAGFSRMRGGKRFIITLMSCRTKYTHLILPVKKRTTSTNLVNKELSSELSMGYWSEVLSAIPWLWSYYDASTSKNFCGWWRERLLAVPSSPCANVAAERTDACFLVVGGNRYLAHKSILSAKSKKLAAAFRFSVLQQERRGNGCLDEVELDLPLNMLSFLMQHCYHGSIFFGLSNEMDVCSHELIDLALVADEYICPTLLAECEMRLISLSGAKKFCCFCWCCCCNVQRNGTKGEEDFISEVQSTIECDYTVSLPPITALSNNVGVAVTVLALCQQWAPCYYTGYEVTVYGVDSSNCHFRYPMHQPFMVAKLWSLKTVLFYGFWPDYNYNTLLSSLDITKRVGDDSSGTFPSHDETDTVALLEYCLDEISKYSLITN